VVNPLHTKLAAVAERLINENGATMTLVNETTTGPDYDPVVTEITQDVIAVRTKFSANEVGDGSRIKSTDVKLLMSSAVDPKLYQKVNDGVDEMQIVNADVIKPGELVIIYKVQARL
jgi:hypothetical protein